MLCPNWGCRAARASGPRCSAQTGAGSSRSCPRRQFHPRLTPRGRRRTRSRSPWPTLSPSSPAHVHNRWPATPTPPMPFLAPRSPRCPRQRRTRRGGKKCVFFGRFLAPPRFDRRSAYGGGWATPTVMRGRFRLSTDSFFVFLLLFPACSSVFRNAGPPVATFFVPGCAHGDAAAF